ncbi:MAG: helix-turn-helix domain-containing protein, partial [Gammaproteobacteria bacterium]
MATSYRRITLAEREEISLALVQGLSYQRIARRLG